MLFPVKTSPVIQPLSATGLPAASYAQFIINPQLFHFSATTDPHHHTGAGRTDRDNKSTMQERDHDLSETESQEKVHQQEQDGMDTSGIYKGPGQRTAKSQEAPHLRSKEEEETEGLHDIGKGIIGREASKKHKSK